MHRFFVSPERIDGERISLAPDQARQIARVLRLRPGDRVCVLDGSGRECVAVLTELNSGAAAARAEEWRSCTGEPRTRLCLGLGILKGERMDWAIQKATEIGAAEIAPVSCARSVARVAEDRFEERLRRWRKIAQEAAEQCRRGRVPVVSPPLSLDALLKRIPEFDRALLAHADDATPLAAALDRPDPALMSEEGTHVLLLVGPEGGFTEGEVSAARAAGARIVSLGARVLRAETAALVGTALVLHHLEG